MCKKFAVRRLWGDPLSRMLLATSGLLFTISFVLYFLAFNFV